APPRLSLPLIAESSKPSEKQSPFPSEKTDYQGKGMQFIKKLLTPIEFVADFIQSISDVVESASDFLGPVLPDWMEEVVETGSKYVKTLAKALRAVKNNETYPDNPTRQAIVDSRIDWREAGRSQYCRATYPLVDSVRQPFIGLFNNVVTGFAFGNASNFYVRWTSRLTPYRIQELRSQESIHVYSMVDSSPEKKGKENWTTDSGSLDDHFAVSVICSRPLPRPFSGIFGQPPADRFVSTAQAISYPAAKIAAGSTEKQPHVGWDTLAWDAQRQQAVEWPTVTKPKSTGLLDFSFLQNFVDAVDLPPMKVPWTAKLVPHRIGTYWEMKTFCEGDELDDVDYLDIVPLNHH
ncbi:hypothetical protein N9N28_15670, partial [Rubripirellula amarantea]|nr:hypothetical protein [Rubripirellula amarantea]